MNIKKGIVIALTAAFFVGLMSSTMAVEYNPGVSAGHWVKYGNILAGGTDAPSEPNQTDWFKVEVTAVSGKNVTLHLSGKYKNGTDAEDTSMTVNVETGTLNGSTPGAGFAFIIAGNLQAGNPLPTATPDVSVEINKTETRTYLGAARSVNIFNTTTSSHDIEGRSLSIYDKASGVLLEMNATFRSSLTPSFSYRMSYSAIDTNVFTTGTMGWLQDNMIYVALAIIVVLIAIVAAFILTRNKPSPTPPSPEKAASETEPTSSPNA